MRGVNRATILGNVGQDPEIKYTASGSAIANFSIATSEAWKDKQTGEQQQRTEWHRCSAFGKLAEIIGQYVKRGSKLYVEGKIQTRKWQDQNNQDRYSTEIVVNEMQMLDSRADSSGGVSGSQPSENAAGGQRGEVPPQFDSFEDQIPF